MYLSLIRLNQTTITALWIILFSFHYGFGAPTKGRLEDPIKVNAKTEAVINSALSYLASKQSPTGAWSGETGEEARWKTCEPKRCG